MNRPTFHKKWIMRFRTICTTLFSLFHQCTYLTHILHNFVDSVSISSIFHHCFAFNLPVKTSGFSFIEFVTKWTKFSTVSTVSIEMLQCKTKHVYTMVCSPHFIPLVVQSLFILCLLMRSGLLQSSIFLYLPIFFYNYLFIYPSLNKI